MAVREYSLCKVKEMYFDDFKSNYFKDNKQEKRPYYCVIKGTDNIFRLIPLSFKVDVYRDKIKKEEEKRGECLYYIKSNIVNYNYHFYFKKFKPYAV